MTKPKLAPGQNRRYNVRDTKGKFVRLGIASIAVNCKNCGKLFNTLGQRLTENGGLCGICFLVNT